MVFSLDNAILKWDETVCQAASDVQELEAGSIGGGSLYKVSE